MVLLLIQMSIKCILCFYFDSFLLTLKLPFDAHDSIARHREIPLKINIRSMVEDNDNHIVTKTLMLQMVIRCSLGIPSVSRSKLMPFDSMASLTISLFAQHAWLT